MSVTIDTSGSGGHSIKKRVFVYTNDPGRKRVLLIVRGDVIRFVHISPTRAYIKGNVGEPLSVRVYIRQTADYPFAITGVRSMYGRDIRYFLEEIPERHPREYLLVVDSVRVTPGRINDMIYLDTDHPTRPVLQVPVAGSLSLQPVFSGTEGKPAK